MSYLDRARSSANRIDREDTSMADDAAAYAAVDQAESLARIATALERLADHFAPTDVRERLTRQMDGS